MITKDEYIEYYNKLKAWRDMEDSLYDASHGALSLWEVTEFARIEEAYVSMLEKLSNDLPDENGTSTISYFMYELNEGKDYKPGCMKKDGKDIKLETIEDVWGCVNGA